MQRLTVKTLEEKHSKDGSKSFWALIDSDDGEFTTFDSSIATVKPGDVIEAEIVVKGKYANIKEFKIIAKEKPPEVAQSKEPQERQRQGRSPDERESIEAQTALKGAVELMTNKIIDLEHPVSKAAFAWTLRRLGAEDIFPETRKQKQPETPQVAPGQARQPSKTEPSPVASEAKPGAVETGAVSNMAGFVTWSDFVKNTTATKWRDTDIMAFIRSKANYQGLTLGPTVKATIARMDKAQAEFLEKELASRLELA